jgi:hypothetical protein
VDFDQDTRTFTCIILQQQPNIENECSINITYGANCGHNLGVYRGNSTADLIIIPPIDFVEDIDVYCYTATTKVLVPLGHTYYNDYKFDYESGYFTVGMIGNLTLQTIHGEKI